MVIGLFQIAIVLQFQPKLYLLLTLGYGES